MPHAQGIKIRPQSAYGVSFEAEQMRQTVELCGGARKWIFADLVLSVWLQRDRHLNAIHCQRDFETFAI